MRGLIPESTQDRVITTGNHGDISLHQSRLIKIYVDLQQLSDRQWGCVFIVVVALELLRSQTPATDFGFLELRPLAQASGVGGSGGSQ